MSATLSKVQVEDRQVWCVCWQSPSRRSASYWYFEHENEAAAAHERLRSWESGQSSGVDNGTSSKRR